MKYYSIGEFADKIGKTIQTLRNWDKNNTFKPAYVTTGGTRYYSQEHALSSWQPQTVWIYLTLLSCVLDVSTERL